MFSGTSQKEQETRRAVHVTNVSGHNVQFCTPSGSNSFYACSNSSMDSGHGTLNSQCPLSGVHRNGTTEWDALETEEDITQDCSYEVIEETDPKQYSWTFLNTPASTWIAWWNWAANLTHDESSILYRLFSTNCSLQLSDGSLIVLFVCSFVILHVIPILPCIISLTFNLIQWVFDSVQRSSWMWVLLQNSIEHIIIIYYLHYCLGVCEKRIKFVNWTLVTFLTQIICLLSSKYTFQLWKHFFLVCLIPSHRGWSLIAERPYGHSTAGDSWSTDRCTIRLVISSQSDRRHTSCMTWLLRLLLFFPPGIQHFLLPFWKGINVVSHAQTEAPTLPSLAGSNDPLLSAYYRVVHLI